MLMMRWLFWDSATLRRKQWGPDAPDALVLLALRGNSGVLMPMMRWLFWHLVALRRKQWGPDAHDALALLAFGGLKEETVGP